MENLNTLKENTSNNSVKELDNVIRNNGKDLVTGFSTTNHFFDYISIENKEKVNMDGGSKLKGGSADGLDGDGEEEEDEEERVEEVDEDEDEGFANNLKTVFSVMDDVTEEEEKQNQKKEIIDSITNVSVLFNSGDDIADTVDTVAMCEKYLQLCDDIAKTSTPDGEPVDRIFSTNMGDKNTWLCVDGVTDVKYANPLYIYFYNFVKKAGKTIILEFLNDTTMNLIRGNIIPEDITTAMVEDQMEKNINILFALNDKVYYESKEDILINENGEEYLEFCRTTIFVLLRLIGEFNDHSSPMKFYTDTNQDFEIPTDYYNPFESGSRLSINYKQLFDGFTIEQGGSLLSQVLENDYNQLGSRCLDTYTISYDKKAFNKILAHARRHLGFTIRYSKRKLDRARMNIMKLQSNIKKSNGNTRNGYLKTFIIAVYEIFTYRYMQSGNDYNMGAMPCRSDRCWKFLGNTTCMKPVNPPPKPLNSLTYISVW